MTAAPGGGLYGDLYGTAAMREIFSTRRRLRALLDVEAALARAQARLGIIPAAAAEAIAAAAAGEERFDVDAIVRRTEVVGYPIVPLVRTLATFAGDAGGYVHWGATTQDILDTATVLQWRDAFALLDADLVATASALVARARRHRDDPMAGRTHLQHALPVTFGFVCASWAAPLLAHRARLRAAVEAFAQVQFGGAVGTLSSLGERGPEVTAALAGELGLAVPLVPWHADRSAFAAALSALALACGSLAKFATDVALLAQTEVAEVAEPHEAGRGGSSTMPQKRNPISSEYVIACARGVHALVPLMWSSMAGDHQRSTGPWQSEELALGAVPILASGAFAQAAHLARGMTVDVARMRANLDLTGGTIVSETVAMALAASIGHAGAHHAVEAAVGATLQSGRPFLDVLAEEPAIAAHLDRARLTELLDPARSTGASGVYVDRVVAAAGAALA